MHTLEAHVCAFPAGRLCEGPVWDARTGALLWVDIRRGHIHRATPAPDGLRLDATISLSPPVSAVLPCASGALLVTAGNTIARLDDPARHFDPVPSGSDSARSVPAPGLLRVAEVALPADGVRRRFNDAKVDPRGRLLAGTMAEAGGVGSSALYRLDQDGTLSALRTGVTISNGLGWSPDGRTLYYADSPTHRVQAFDYDLDTGTLGAPRPFAHFADGEPDGLTVDADGRVWVAVWGAGQVRAFDPSGKPYATVEVGPSQVSSCTFAGPDLDLLVITTAAEQDAAGEPNAGRLFTCVPGVTGLPATPFADQRLVHANGR
ncbi:SMP-30/gluconolactonase/LRE family protein [Nocardia yunnanensis]|uniref:SMP-30/gluconolactonase/LRE family protein n=1 Tax=Nocardia yunnanensis TaxID=2382165 RepID=A0A386ZKZ6_9NOCA|nr:SMP-30/gluconolactonase/LRE family protein [Nocardia yunnanensis]AYF77814.1 SMP-30/gluconolactonase/LRE family protein [Nocardia yunnanensis]